MGDQAEFAAMAKRLGDRVKGFRARRGMSRRDLSLHTGISERYLAQLESGQANVSYNILWLLAQAMGLPIAELIEAEAEGHHPDLPLARKLLESLSPEQQSEAYVLLRQTFKRGIKLSRRVALVGLRGAGKTTLGKRLAERYGVPFVRVTSVIEQIAGMDMTEILLSMGQKGYRKLEFSALETSIASQPSMVLESGGSLVSEPHTYDLLLQSCFTVWIQASPEEHMRRVMSQGDLRPIEGQGHAAMEDLRSILEARSHLYGRADATLDTSARSVDDSLEELSRLCASHLGL
ncbi:helix-turn-helix transcriptional regulator [Magnetospirillum sp. SS-4]|uniref:helix-turn-helix transcriptional regulator n=1 Tax=Magnetospirillum sp. SS-4 TaxID=2681465 RepID=UPI00137CBD42|nr:helix-turn-helix transcriptional regulator [Magnetospirillum sp. SS-4]CAA7616734.1 Shikimate kinase [Magnetospirillum sp. SS-4]